MSIFNRLCTGVLDTVYGFKLGRFRSQLERQEKTLRQLIVRKPEMGKALDLFRIRHVLVVKNESLADMVMVTPLIRNLAVNGYRVDVLASEANQMVLEHNPYVHEVIVQTGGMSGANKFVQEQMKGRRYDVVMDLRNPVYDENLESLLFPQHIVCDYLVGWNRSNVGIYNESLNFYDEKGRFTDVIAAFLKYLSIESADFSYDIPVSVTRRESCLHYMRNLWRKGGPVILVYPFSEHQGRSLSEFQINGLVDKILECYPFGQIILSGLPHQVNQIKVNSLQEEHVHKCLCLSEMEMVSLLEYADIVITPETWVMHMAAAFSKPLVALSTSMEGVALKSKEKVQNEHEYQMQLLMASFLDASNIQAGVRPNTYLLGEHVFTAVGDKWEWIFSNTLDMTYLSIDAVVGAFQRLAMQHVHDPQYVSPVKALSYIPPEEQNQAQEDTKLCKEEAEILNEEAVDNVGAADAGLSEAETGADEVEVVSEEAPEPKSEETYQEK